MELGIGMARACSPDGCLVRLLNDGAEVACGYAAAVHNRIKVRPGDLVAVDMAAGPPLVVWRWRQAQVVAVEGGSVLLTRNVTQRAPGGPRTATFAVPLPVAPHDAIRPGDAVIYAEEGILAVVTGGVPDSEAAFRAAFPRILAAYAA